MHANKISINRIEEQLANQYNCDFNERASTEQEELSREDRKYVEIMECSVQLQNRHYKFQLPLKGKDVAMPNNCSIVVQCVYGLKKRLQKNASFQKEYADFLSDVISDGYAEQAPQNLLETSTGNV